MIMCACPAHNELVDCVCQCDHTNDRISQWQARALQAEHSAAQSADDLRRELTKTVDTLMAAEKHLARHAEANAALHCADRVMYSPLHARVTAAIHSARAALHQGGTDGD